MSRSQIIRGLIFEALQGYTYKGVEIPVFDEVINPEVTLPAVDNAQEVYVVMQDQQELYDAVQTACSPRFVLNITLRVVTKWGLTASKTVCENITSDLLSRIRTNRGESLLPDQSIQKIGLSISRSISETTRSNISLSQITILKIIYNG